MLAELQLPGIEWLATWVAKSLEPLSRTGLGFTKWEAEARETGAYIATLLVVALLAARLLWWRKRQRSVFIVTLLSVLALLVANTVLSILNNHLTGQQQILTWRDEVWKWFYVLLCASVPCLLATATFLIGSRPRT
jgi:hypothetical protein